tara:strand:- start:21334 stop:22155 length:822 start_codon:yes stop_codon:yes gene_type:complete
MTNYLQPTAIPLTALTFTKIDVGSGTGTFTAASFAIEDYGTLTNVIISVQRSEKKMTYSCTGGAAAYTSNNNLLGSASGYSHATLIEDVTNYHPNFANNSRPPAEILMGTIFNMMVRTIFQESGSTIVTTGIDFTQVASRQTNVFFYDVNESSDDATEGLPSDVITQTIAKFNAGQIGDGTEWTDEMAYWSYRTSSGGDPGVESENVNLSPGDKIHVQYSLACAFVGGGDGTVAPALVDNDALDTPGTNIAFAGTNFSNADVTIKFILSWVVA